MTLIIMICADSPELRLRLLVAINLLASATLSF
jgi:hypothetical protein